MVVSIGETGSEVFDSEAVFEPLQPPEGGFEEALQLVASVEDQVRVKESPKVIEGSEAERVTVGAGGGGTITGSMRVVGSIASKEGSSEQTKEQPGDSDSGFLQLPIQLFEHSLLLPYTVSVNAIFLEPQVGHGDQSPLVFCLRFLFDIS